MGKVKQIEIKNQTSYFYSDIINIKEFDCENWWLWKYLQCKSLYLIIGKVDGHIEEKNRVNI